MISFKGLETDERIMLKSFKPFSWIVWYEVFCCKFVKFKDLYINQKYTEERNPISLLVTSTISSHQCPFSKFCAITFTVVMSIVCEYEVLRKESSYNIILSRLAILYYILNIQTGTLFLTYLNLLNDFRSKAVDLLEPAYVDWSTSYLVLYCHLVFPNLQSFHLYQELYNTHFVFIKRRVLELFVHWRTNYYFAIEGRHERQIPIPDNIAFFLN